MIRAFTYFDMYVCMSICSMYICRPAIMHQYNTRRCMYPCLVCASLCVCVYICKYWRVYVQCALVQMHIVIVDIQSESVFPFVCRALTLCPSSLHFSSIYLTSYRCKYLRGSRTLASVADRRLCQSTWTYPCSDNIVTAYFVCILFCMSHCEWPECKFPKV